MPPKICKVLHPALRDSGFYVSEEFVKMGDFQDVGKFTGFVAPFAYIAQAVDKGVFGGMFQRNVQFPAELGEMARMMLKDTLNKPVVELAQKYNQFGVGKKAFRQRTYDVVVAVSDSWKLPIDKLKKLPDVQKATVGMSEKEIDDALNFAKEFRPLADGAIEGLNMVRGKRGQKLVGYEPGYLPEMVHYTMQDRIRHFLFSSETAEPYFLDFLTPNEFKDPHALERLGHSVEIERDWFKVWHRYTENITRDIFNTNTIQNAKIHAAYLRGEGLDNAALLTERWAAESYGGVKAPLDRFISHTGPLAKSGYFLRAQLNRAVFPLNWSWNMLIQTTSVALIPQKIGLRNTIVGFEYIFNPTVRRQVRESGKVYSWSIKTKRGEGMLMQDIAVESGPIFSPTGNFIEKAGYYANFMTRLIESNITGAAVWGGYRHATQMGMKGRTAWQWASEIGRKTQSMYNIEDLPAVLRNRFVGVIVPFQTFSLECFNSLGEMSGIRVLGRKGSYYTVATNSIEGQAHLHIRMKKFGEFVAAMIATNMINDNVIGRQPWTASTFIPFFNLVFGGTDIANPWGHPMTTKYVNDFWTGFNDLMKYDSWEGLRSWFFKYHVTGGVQIERMWEGIEFIANEGVEKNVLGEEVFKLDDPNDWGEYIKAFFLGPWATEPGMEEINEKSMPPWAWEEWSAAIERHEGLLEDYKKYLRKETGIFSEFFGFDLPVDVDIRYPFDIQVCKSGRDAGTRLWDIEGMIGAVDEEDNVLTTNKFKSMVNYIQGLITPGQFQEAIGNSPLAALWYKDKTETLAEYNALADAEYADEVARDEAYENYRIANPNVDAALFFWGEVDSLKTPMAYQIVQDLVSRYSIPSNALPTLEKVDERQLQLAWDMRPFDAEYEQVPDDQKDEYLEIHPEYARMKHEDKAWEMVRNIAHPMEEKYVQAYIEFRLSGAPRTNVQKRWLLVHPDFYEDVYLGIMGSDEIDWVKVPTVEMEQMYDQQYMKLPEGEPRTLFRCRNEAFDHALSIGQFGGEYSAIYGSETCRVLFEKIAETPPTEETNEDRAKDFFEQLIGGGGE